MTTETVASLMAALGIDRTDHDRAVREALRELVEAREEIERWQLNAVWLHEGPDCATEEATKAVKELIAEWDRTTTPEPR